MTRRYDKDTYLESLPISVYKELVSALNKDAAWMTLANYIADELEYPRVQWIQSLKETKQSENSPAEKLLSELNIKMCTVEILRTLLDDCGLLNILSIISDPEPLNIIMHPTEELKTDIVRITFGKHLQLCCKATGMPPPTFLWYHNDKELQNSTFNKLDILINSASQAGEYKCKVFQIKNNGTLISTLTSSVVTVQICPIPVTIELQPQPLLEVKSRESFIISCKASGYPEPCYQWFQDNKKLTGETSNTLHIKEFSSKHEGKYECYAYNDVNGVYTQTTHIIMQLPRLKAVAKVALIIANGDYYNLSCLSTPKNDAAYLGSLLKEIGFEVICLVNLTTAQMRNAIELFSKLLHDGVYGLFYFAGHGFKMQESYMLAVDSPEEYLRIHAICESDLLAAFLEKDPVLIVIILDMCQILPSKECNPDIYNELPAVKEYKSKKNLRNLIQAYSTSSHRPSYERLSSKYGLYMTHLSKYINKDMLAIKVFEEVGKSIDNCFKGKERNQIPMFAQSVTKPFRLTDDVYGTNLPEPIIYLKELIAFPTRTIDIIFKQINFFTKVTISPLMEPYSNLVKVQVHNMQDFEINFANLVRIEPNNLYQDQQSKVCWIHNPQTNQGPLVIFARKNGTTEVSAILHIKDYTPSILKYINC